METKEAINEENVEKKIKMEENAQEIRYWRNHLFYSKRNYHFYIDLFLR